MVSCNAWGGEANVRRPALVGIIWGFAVVTRGGVVTSRATAMGCSSDARVLFEIIGLQCRRWIGDQQHCRGPKTVDELVRHAGRGQQRGPGPHRSNLVTNNRLNGPGHHLYGDIHWM